MYLNDDTTINTALRVQNLYKSNTYISYSDIHSIQFQYPKAWTVFKAFIAGRGVFTDTLTSRKILKHYTSEAYRISYNKKVVAEAQKNLFSIEGHFLDKQQIEAIYVTEDAHLVMAAAGSGKTLSLLAKCKYLVEERHIPAKRILTVSFTSSSASELAERLHGLGIEVDGKTFHALGNAILKKVKTIAINLQTNKNYSAPS
jgi:superfamily I DNA and RNA helicase